MNKTNKQIDISIVVPVYGCAECLEELHNRLVIVLNSLVSNYEIILVEDASPDDSWQRILQLTKDNSSVKGIRLSRNFGQHKAITAGLDFATGEWIVVMDCDLQDKPEEITKLYQKAIAGYDIVFARRYDRKDGYLKKLGSKLFYKFMSYMTDTKLDPAIANFGVYNKKVIHAVKGMRENLRYFPVMVKWVGFTSTTIDVVHSERNSGKSSYSLKKLMNLSIDVVVSFTEKPLKLIVCLGMFISILSALYALYILIGAIAGNIEVEGWASVMVSIWFISGVIISMLGVVGVYVGKAFNETKKRPQYIISNTVRSKN